MSTEALRRIVGLIPARWRRREIAEPPAFDSVLVYKPPPVGVDFDRGVEFGLLYARVADFGCVEAFVRADLAELVMRLAESRDLPFRAAPHEHGPGCADSVGRNDCRDGSEWLDVTIGAAVSR